MYSCILGRLDTGIAACMAAMHGVDRAWEGRAEAVESPGCAIKDQPREAPSSGGEAVSRLEDTLEHPSPNESISALSDHYGTEKEKQTCRIVTRIFFERGFEMACIRRA